MKWVLTGKVLSGSLVLLRSMGRLPCSRLGDSCITQAFFCLVSLVPNSYKVVDSGGHN